METRANHFIIGLFTLIILTGIILSLTWLNNKSQSSEFLPYDIVFQEAVTGLNKGSLVEFNGIRVGEVNSLSLDQNDPTKVIARIFISPDTPMRNDTQAKLITSGITGISTIRLTSGQQATSRPLMPQKNSIPKIQATPSSLTKLLSNGESLITLLNDITSQMKQLLSNDNQEKTVQILANLEKVTQKLAKQDNRIDELIEQAIQASQQTNLTLKTTNQLLKNQGTEAFEKSIAALTAAEKTFNIINLSLEENGEDLNQSFAGFAELGSTLIEIRQTMESFRQISEQLESNPGNYFFSTGKIKEYKHD